MSDCLILYISHHKAYIVGVEPTEIPALDHKWNVYIHIHIFSYISIPQRTKTFCIVRHSYTASNSIDCLSMPLGTLEVITLDIITH